MSIAIRGAGEGRLFQRRSRFCMFVDRKDGASAGGDGGRASRKYGARKRPVQSGHMNTGQSEGATNDGTRHNRRMRRKERACFDVGGLVPTNGNNHGHASRKRGTDGQERGMKRRYGLAGESWEGGKQTNSVLPAKPWHPGRGFMTGSQRVARLTRSPSPNS